MPESASQARVAELEKQVYELKQQLAEARHAREPEPVDDFTFTDTNATPVKLSELFGGKSELIVVHNMGKSCVYCTLWADGLRGLLPHIESRAAFVLSSADPADVLKAFAQSRDWPYRCVSAKGSGFAKAMGYENDKGSPQPGVSAFVKRDDGTILRTGHTPFGPGDDFCAIWPLFDLLPGGSTGWAPKYQYP